MKEDNETKAALFRNDYISHLFAMQIAFCLLSLEDYVFIVSIHCPPLGVVSLNTKGKLKLILFETREGDFIVFMACVNFSNFSNVTSR